MTMTKQQAETFVEALKPELEVIGKKLGFKITVGNGKFLDVLELKLVCSPIDAETGEVVNREAEDFKRLCRFYGLDPTDLNKCFRNPADGRVYEVIGLKSKGKKYPIICKKMSDGKRYKFMASTINSYLEKHLVEG